MQHTLFIADLHLDEKHPASHIFFDHFIEKQIASAQALYILGDFFEVWIGDDYYSPFYEKIKQHLNSVAQKIPVYFMNGNRDFLVGRKFARETGCKLLPEFSVIKLYGENVVLLHGDALCSLDEKHMKFRKMTQNPFVRTLFLSLPLSLRKKIGFRIRQASKQHHHAISNHLLNVVPETVADVFKKHQVNRMIHGHTHQPRVFNQFLNNVLSERIVLGSWEHHGCVLKWYPNGKREMIFFR